MGQDRATRSRERVWGCFDATDIAVDQGGRVETIQPTTQHDPVYTVDGILHCGVANMPGAVSRSSTFALANATLPHFIALAEKGLDGARKAARASRSA